MRLCSRREAGAPSRIRDRIQEYVLCSVLSWRLVLLHDMQLQTLRHVDVVGEAGAIRENVLDGGEAEREGLHSASTARWLAVPRSLSCRISAACRRATCCW